MNPTIGATYTFVRVSGDAITHTEFTRHADGSGGFLADGRFSMHECDPNAWRSALEELANRGFVELSVARETGLVPATWKPTEDNSEVARCVGAVVAVRVG